jgi:hypothetical protein
MKQLKDYHIQVLTANREIHRYLDYTITADHVDMLSPSIIFSINAI